MRTPRPGPTSRTTSAVAELAQAADDAEDVLVDEEVLAERLLGRDGHGSPKAAAALACVAAASSSNVSPRASASTWSVWTTFAGSFGRPRTRLRSEVRAVGLDEDPIARESPRPHPQRGRVRVGGVPGERDVVPALDGDGDELRRREAVEDDRAAERLERARGLVVGLAVVDHDRELELVRERELRVEQPALLLGGRVPANGVEPGLADGDRLGMREQLAELVDALRLRRRGLMRIDAERRVDAVVRLGDRERSATRVDPGADRDDPRHAGLARPLDEGRCVLLARVEMRVRVGHCAEAASIRSSSSATTASGSSLAKSGAGSTQRLAGRKLARLPPACPARVVAGEHDVLLAVLGDRLERERTGDDVVVAECLVQALRQRTEGTARAAP